MGARGKGHWIRDLSLGALGEGPGREAEPMFSDRHKMPSCHEAMRKWPPVGTGYLSHHGCEERGLCHKDLLLGTSRGACGLLLVLLCHYLLLEEAKLPFCHQVRQSGECCVLPAMCQTSWVQISACGLSKLTSGLSASVSPPIKCGWCRPAEQQFQGSV